MFGQRLRLARKRAGLSMRALADAMSPKVTAQAISKYEAGKMLPSSAVLVGLGKALDVSLDFLMSAQVEALDAVEFRKHSGASARDRARAEAVVMDSLERYLAIEHILDIEASVDWVERRRYDSVASESQIDERADELRGVWDLGRDPIPSLCELLEDKGIKVVEADLPESINGLSCHILSGGEIVAEAVVVSSRINVERKRFTLAHELAHRIIRSTGNPAIDLEGGDEPLRRRVPGSRSVPSGGSRRRSAQDHLLRDCPSETYIRRVGRGPADASRAGGRTASRLRAARLRDLRPVLAQVGAGSDPPRPWVRGLREASSLQATRLARGGRGADLARARGRASQPVPRIRRAADQRSCHPVTCVVVNDASCLIDLRKGGLLGVVCNLPYRFVIPLPVRASEVLDVSEAEWQALDEAGMITHDLTPEEVGRRSW